jgi:uncharacterized membrane protein YgcG
MSEEDKKYTPQNKKEEGTHMLSLDDLKASLDCLIKSTINYYIMQSSGGSGGSSSSGSSPGVAGGGNQPSLPVGGSGGSSGGSGPSNPSSNLQGSHYNGFHIR